MMADAIKANACGERFSSCNIHFKFNYLILLFYLIRFIYTYKNQVFSHIINAQIDFIFADFDMRQSSYKYFAQSERDKSWGVYALNCGETIVAAFDEFPQKDHPSHHYFHWQRGRILQEYQMFYILEGEGIFESLATGERPLRPGDIVLLFPGVWHRYKPLPHSNWHTYWVGFHGSFIQHLVREFFFTHEKAIIHLGYLEHIVQDFLEIQRLGGEEYAGYQQAMAGHIMKILATITVSQHRGQFQNNNQEEIVQRARVLLTEHITSAVCMEKIAQELNLGYSYFRRLFKQYTGLAPGQYLIQLRIEKAKNLLADPNRPIKQIAFDLGFESVFYFSRLFKEKIGMSPAQFRRFSSGHREKHHSKI
jgi:AraC-like DNA-binding protein